jgi:hypothetical protein
MEQSRQKRHRRFFSVDVMGSGDTFLDFLHC